MNILIVLKNDYWLTIIKQVFTYIWQVIYMTMSIINVYSAFTVNLYAYNILKYVLLYRLTAYQILVLYYNL